MYDGPSGINGTGASLSNSYPAHITDHEVINNFLEHTVEDYLVGDLKTILEPASLQGPNELGYPALMLIMIGCELLGNLIDSNLQYGEAAERFWTYMIKVDPKYDIPRIAYSLYGLARNGIAHYYSPNTTIIVSRKTGDNFSKKLFNGEVKFHINCYETFIDFHKAYELARVDILADQTLFQLRATTIRSHVNIGSQRIGDLTQDPGGLEDYSKYGGYISA